MTEWNKTLAFIGAAVASLGLAAAAATLSRPSSPKEFERVGEQFYPEFEDPTLAQSLKVVSYDEDTSVIKDFDVTWGKDGWAISPYGYPADAADQLEKTAASVIGIVRTGSASRREADQERFGVLDPLNEDATKLKGRGNRITLKDAKGQTLADYILGKPVEGNDGYFYVRTPKEKETYIAKVDLNLSTKFADWIQSDLLKLTGSDLREVEILNQSVDADRGMIVGREQNVLTRDDGVGAWKLDGLDEATEQVNTAEINKVTRVLEDLKIIGVRPKPQGLNADLSLDPKVIDNPLSAQLLRDSLDSKGFYLARGEDGKLQLVSKEGQVIAASSTGIAYELYFGEQFTGSLFDLEFGDAKDANRPKQLKKEDEAKKVEKGRYVFLTARLEAERLGAVPQPPAEPAAVPEGASEEEKKKAADDSKKATEDYEVAKKAYDQKLADAKKQVNELNVRFKKWYYVISSESFQDLRLARAALVQPKAEVKPPVAPGGDGATAAGTLPVEADKPAADTTESAPGAEPADTTGPVPPTAGEPATELPEPEPPAAEGGVPAPPN